MARKVNSISEVNDSNETWKLEVRITTLSLIEKSGIEMLFMDAKGDKISAFVKKFDVDIRKFILKEDKTYIVQNFEVLKNDGHYKTSRHLFKLIFTKGTIVHERDLPAIPKNVYHFTEFEEILCAHTCTYVLVDVIGQFIDIQYQKDTAPKRLVIVLKDQRDNSVHCTLWEQFATKMISFLESHQEGPVIILLSLAKIKYSDGEYPTSIQNSKCGSKLLINEDNDEIRQYKKSLDSNSVYESYSQRLTQLSESSQTSSENKFMKNAHIKDLTDLSGVEGECYCVTVGKIDKICVGNGWSYEACLKCNKKADCTTLPFICQGCGKQNSVTVPRYRIEVMVSHKKDSSKFVLWDRECIQLIKETAADLKKKMLDEGESDPMAVPEAIDCMLGKVMAFRVKVTQGYKNYSVNQISENDNVMEEILQKIPIDEDEIASGKGISTSPVLIKEEDLTETQSLSGTANFDQTLIGNFTPAKRLSNDSPCDDFAEKDLPSGQLSSTKFAKQIKTE